MKGLTPQEVEKLRELAAPEDMDLRDEAEREILDGLVEQGRVSLRVEKWEDETHEYTHRRWEITTQGREALRLFEKLAGAA